MELIACPNDVNIINIVMTKNDINDILNGLQEMELAEEIDVDDYAYALWELKSEIRQFLKGKRNIEVDIRPRQI